MIQLNVNGKTLSLDADPNMPLLYALRDLAQLTGTKFGCGAGLCGACTVHLDGVPIRSCVTPVSAAAGQKVITIEGLAKQGELHPLQQAWIDHKVAQCGYCQCGQIMTAAALLQQTPKPSEADIENYMQGNICRCGTYPRIKQAILAAAAAMPKNAAKQNPVGIYQPAPTVDSAAEFKVEPELAFVAANNTAQEIR